jgi:preprotein translocase subunit SecG
VSTLYNILLGLGLFVAFVFGMLVLLTGKGDAMSGGSSVRTTFKGKASFDDYMTRVLLSLGVSFMVVLLALDVVGNKIQPR